MKRKKIISESPFVSYLIGSLFFVIAFLIALFSLQGGDTDSVVNHANMLFAAVSLLWAFAALFVGTLFFASPIASFIGDFSARIFNGGEHFSKPQPAYSLPDGLAATGQHACAILAYNELAKNHPEEILPHLRVMRIWIEKMNDVEAAVMVYNLAMKTIRGQKNRNEFAKMAKNNFSKFISFE
jgi:hypothetical protein